MWLVWMSFSQGSFVHSMRIESADIDLSHRVSWPLTGFIYHSRHAVSRSVYLYRANEVNMALQVDTRFRVKRRGYILDFLLITSHQIRCTLPAPTIHFIKLNNLLIWPTQLQHNTFHYIHRCTH